MDDSHSLMPCTYPALRGIENRMPMKLAAPRRFEPRAVGMRMFPQWVAQEIEYSCARGTAHVRDADGYDHQGRLRPSTMIGIQVDLFT